MRGLKHHKPLPIVVIRIAKAPACAHCGWVSAALDGNEENYIGTVSGDPAGPLCWDCWIKFLGAMKP